MNTNDPFFPKPHFESMLPRTPKDYNLASEFHDRLINWINDFHKALDENHEVGARLVNFGQSVTFHIEDIGYWNPSLISFMGKNEQGEAVKLVQHVSQKAECQDSHCIKSKSQVLVGG